MEKDITEIRKEVTDYINEQLDSEKKEIRNDTILTEYEGFNSMFVVELIMKIEELTGITIPDEMYVMDRFNTIDSIIEGIEKIMNENIA